jgi:outer membrane protein OmpA-like peptidoglycan-associated protein
MYPSAEIRGTKARPIAGWLALAVLGLFLAGCATSPLDDLNDAAPSGSAFDQALFRDYESLARSFDATPGQQNDTGFFSDPLAWLGITSPEPTPNQMLAEAFADKALIAAKGEDVQPEPAGDPESQGMRARLIQAVNAGKARFAEDAARAQVDYDCWRLNASVPSQAASAAQCRTALNASLGRLEGELNQAQFAPPPPPVAPPPVAAAPVAPAPVASAPADYTVYFDFDSWTLTAEDLTVLTNVINTARAGRQSHITVIGHTDTAGPSDYNQNLSVKRANVVVEALVDMGARRAAIEASGVGESDLAVATADGVREPKNRRAVIGLVP